MTINPDAAKVVELIIASGRPPYPTIGHKAAREIFVASRAILQPDPSPVGEVRDLAADGPAGKIPLRLYRGQGTDASRPQPTLIYYHGGGWVLGNLESHDGVCRDIANAADPKDFSKTVKSVNPLLFRRTAAAIPPTPAPMTATLTCRAWSIGPARRAALIGYSLRK